MTERIFDAPVSTPPTEISMEPRPSGAVAFMLWGPQTTDSLSGSNGVGWTVGLGDMTKRYAQASGVSQIGLFSPKFDGSGNGFSDFAFNTNSYPPPTLPPRKEALSTFNFAAAHSTSNVGDAWEACDHVYHRNSDTVHALPIGYLGSAVEVVVSQATLRTTPGTQSVTGIGFEPDLVILLGAHPALGGTSDNGCRFELGAFDADGNQWAIAERSVYLSGPSILGGLLNKVTRMSRLRSDRCLLHIGAQGSAQPTTVTQEAEFFSMDADGFTINVLSAGLDSGGNASRFAYLAARMPEDGAVMVGVSVQDDPSVSVGFQPDLMLFASNLSTGEAETTHAYLAVGGADETKQRGYWGGSGSGGVGGGPPVSSGAFSSVFALLLGLGANGEVTLTEDGCDIDWVLTDSAGVLFAWIAISSGEDTETPSASATTELAEAVCDHATLYGTVDPGDDEADVYFDYGPTIAYGTSVLAGTISGAPDLVAVTVFGLIEGATYHFRVRAVVGSCVYLGNDMTFTVGPCGRAVRVLTDKISTPLSTSNAQK